jgi:(p)ppGpp synthase/HD superfamily hydrolase
LALGPRFQEALVFAAQLHANQVRKGSGIPYVSHLIGVASIALEYGAGEDEAIAALLHDAVEDQGGKSTGKVIRQRFGDTVADIVEACSESSSFPKPPWRWRKERYLKDLLHASPAAFLVSASDKLHNARSILRDYRQLGDKLWSRFSHGQAGVLWYYRALVDVYQAQAPDELQPLVEELDRVVSTIEQLVAAAQV